MATDPRPHNARYNLVAISFIVLFIVMFVWLGTMQLGRADYYASLAEDRSTRTYSLYGKRGTIYDTDMIPLAYDKVSYNVTFYRDPTKTSAANRKEYTKAIVETLDIIEKNGKTIDLEFWLKRDENNEWIFETGGTTEYVINTRINQWRSNFLMANESKYPTEKLFDMLCENYAVPDYLTEEEKIKVLSVWQLQRMNNFTGNAVTIAEDVGYECVCQIEAVADTLPGIEGPEGSTPVYPHKETACHVLGYISKITSDESLDEYRQKGYPTNALIGASGIEASLEDQLSQYVQYRQGERIVEVNLKGKATRELEYSAPVDGNDVILTIDSDLQAVAEQALADVIAQIHVDQEEAILHESWLDENAEVLAQYEAEDRQIQMAQTGALVAMDPNTGRVKALVSSPGFDLSMFEGSTVDKAYYNQLVEDELSPMFNRAISSRDTPGSIFKLVTSLGALKEGVLGLDERISDGGYYEGLDTSRKGPRCWIALDKIYQHANQDITLAIAHSCNYFFYEISYRLGINNLNKWAAQLGLTSKTGIELNGETMPFVGSQDKLYDAERTINAQYTSKPLIAYNTIVTKINEIGEERGEIYDNDKVASAAKQICDLADSDLEKSQWVGEIYTILGVELGIPSSYLSNHLYGNDFFYMINDLRWTASETIMAGIGQSITQVTPIAVARYVSAIANGGTVYDAQIVEKIVSPTGEVIIDKEPVVANTITDAEEYIAAIKVGMEDVSNSEEGTASGELSRAKYPLAAKTGTSQRTELDVENNAWLVTYAPLDDPQIVVVVYVQNGYAGLRTGKAAVTVSDYYLDSINQQPATTIAEENKLA